MPRLDMAVLGLAIAAAGVCAAPGPNAALGPADAINQARASIETPTATYAGPGIRLVPSGPAVPRRPWTVTLAVCARNVTDAGTANTGAEVYGASYPRTERMPDG